MPSITTWMTVDVVVVDPEKTVHEACAIMVDRRIGSLVIIDEENRPVGIFTERDSLYKVSGKGLDVKTTRIKDVMSTDMKTARTEESFKNVYNMMTAYKIRHLPIVDERGLLVGIVSVRDLLRFNMRAMEKAISDYKKEIEFLSDILDKSADDRTKTLYEKNKELQELVMTDSLTGLFNHKYFREILTREVFKAKRYFRPLTLLFIDIDHFKHYNDKNGHERGNEVLKQISEILLGTSRRADTAFRLEPMDIVARYGGEEFVILLPETQWRSGIARAKRLLKEVRNFDFYNGGSQPLGRLTVSVGVAEFPKQATDADDLIATADNALYKAKETGRDRVC